MKRLWSFLLPAVLLLASTPALADLIQGKVVGVTDGDTIEVLVGQKTFKVRLNGIDAPEEHQAYGMESKKALSSFIYGKDVAVNIVDRDKYDRAIADVSFNGVNVNQEMVRTGNAWWFEKYAKDNQTLKAFQAQAQTSGKGLWSNPRAVSPWAFREATKNSGKNLGNVLPPNSQPKNYGALIPPGTPKASGITKDSYKQYLPSSPTKPTQQTSPTASGTNPADRPALDGYGAVSSTTGRKKTTKVNGYYRKDGTYVRPHYTSR